VQQKREEREGEVQKKRRRDKDGKKKRLAIASLFGDQPCMADTLLV